MPVPSMRILTLTFFLFSLVPYLLLADNIDKIKNKIASEYQNYYKDYAIDIEEIIPHFRANSQIHEVQITNITLLNSSLPASSYLRLDFLYKGKKFHQVLNYEVKATLRALYAKTSIQKNEEISKEKIYTQRLPLRSLKSMIMKESQIGKFSAKTHIPSNSLILLQHTASKILIHKNMPFIGTYQTNSLSAQTTLIAKQDGRENDIIQAINPESNKSVRVRVLGNGEGEIL